MYDQRPACLRQPPTGKRRANERREVYIILYCGRLSDHGNARSRVYLCGPSHRGAGPATVFCCVFGEGHRDLPPVFDRIGITSSHTHRVRFEITKPWKGVKCKEFVVTTRLSGEACGYPFERGKEYLVYVVDTSGDIETGGCPARC